MPPKFKGPFSEYYKLYIEPFLPSPQAVAHVHGLLVTYLDTDEILIVRNFAPYSIRGLPYEIKNTSRKMICSDNEAALWIYNRTRLEQLNDVQSFSHLITQRMFPIAWAPIADDGESYTHWSNWGKKTPESLFSAPGRLHAHLCDAANDVDEAKLDLDQVRMRSFRFLHPANHFPIPNKSKFINLGSGPKDFGAIPEVKAFITEQFSKRYAAIWAEFCKYAKPEKLPAACDFEFHYERKVKEEKREETQAPAPRRLLQRRTAPVGQQTHQVGTQTFTMKVNGEGNIDFSKFGVNYVGANGDRTFHLELLLQGGSRVVFKDLTLADVGAGINPAGRNMRENKFHIPEVGTYSSNTLHFDHRQELFEALKKRWEDEAVEVHLASSLTLTHPHVVGFVITAVRRQQTG